LHERADEPLRVLWEYSWSEAAGVLTMEIMALGSHRPSLRSEITTGTERIRSAQLAALTAKYGEDYAFLDGRFTPDAMVLLLTSMPKYLSLEDGIAVEAGHQPLIEAFQSYLDSVEPPVRSSRRTTQKRRRPKPK